MPTMYNMVGTIHDSGTQCDREQVIRMCVPDVTSLVTGMKSNARGNLYRGYRVF
jgi:hypothetical protein